MAKVGYCAFSGIIEAPQLTACEKSGKDMINFLQALDGLSCQEKLDLLHVLGCKSRISRGLRVLGRQDSV